MLLCILNRLLCGCYSHYFSGRYRPVPVQPDKHFSSLCGSIFRSNFFACFLLLLSVSVSISCSQAEKDAEKDIYGNLELNGKINTFPLCVILSDKLNGNEFPADLKQLCSFTNGTCKTLPVAGILRSGADIYYTYNCFAELKIPGSEEKDEAGITQAVQQQVAAYYSTTKLKEYDSLLTPNEPGWDVQNLPATYINNTSDSVFFYSNQPGFPSAIEVNSRTYPVYTNAAELRKDIDNIICKGYEKIAVFYNPVIADSTARAAKPGYASRGLRAGDSCMQYSRYEKLHDGSGGFMLGKMLQANSPGCGFISQAAVSAPPQAPPAPVPPQTVRKPPVRPTIDPGMAETPAARADNRCASRSEPVCEQDENKNFTGRRVQYCYNKEGDIVRTIVISRCEADCRCF